MKTDPSPPTIFIDGECNLCDRASYFLHQHSPPKTFRFALLQEHPRFFDPSPKGNSQRMGISKTLVVVYHKEIYTGGKAVIFLTSRMNHPYPYLSKGLSILPEWIIEGIYRIIAYFRYRIWGRKPCSLPKRLEH